MDKKLSLLYVSPFWPQRSGISEYSESLVWGLKEYFDIVLLTKRTSISNQLIKKEFKICAYEEKKDYSGYDFIIYNFGNSPYNHDYMYEMLEKYPGYVILHDFALYFLTVDHYRKKDLLFQKIYELEGALGISIVKDSIKEIGNNDLIQHKELPSKLPLNKEVLRNACGLIVHSNYVKDKIHDTDPKIKVHKIELVDCMPHVDLDNHDFLREKYHIKEGEFIIGAVGMIAPTKQNKIACEAVNVYNKSHPNKVKYVMIGEGDYIDSYLNEDIIKTGFLENEPFFNAINSCDVIFNLRYPYNGESSATLTQCLLMGKQCVVTDIGWFSELSDDCVRKVSSDISIEELSTVIEQCVESNVVNDAGKQFVKEKCNAKVVAESIVEFLEI